MLWFIRNRTARKIDQSIVLTCIFIFLWCFTFLGILMWHAHIPQPHIVFITYWLIHELIRLIKQPGTFPVIYLQKDISYVTVWKHNSCALSNKGKHNNRTKWNIHQSEFIWIPYFPLILQIHISCKWHDWCLQFEDLLGYFIHLFFQQSIICGHVVRPRC